jgi:hypothetical protein
MSASALRNWRPKLIHRPNIIASVKLVDKADESRRPSRMIMIMVPVMVVMIPMIVVMVAVCDHTAAGGKQNKRGHQVQDTFHAISLSFSQDSALALTSNSSECAIKLRGALLGDCPLNTNN